MVINLNEYKYVAPTVRARLAKRSANHSLDFTIVNIALETYVPIMVIAHYAAKEMGMTKELKEIIDRMQDTYKYTEVIDFDS